MNDQNIPAGWYHDPTDASMKRYWDGNAWTDKAMLIPQPVSSDPRPAHFPPPTGPPLDPSPPSLDVETSTRSDLEGLAKPASASSSQMSRANEASLHSVDATESDAGDSFSWLGFCILGAIPAAVIGLALYVGINGNWPEAIGFVLAIVAGVGVPIFLSATTKANGCAKVIAGIVAFVIVMTIAMNLGPRSSYYDCYRGRLSLPGVSWGDAEIYCGNP